MTYLLILSKLEFDTHLLSASVDRITYKHTNLSILDINKTHLPLFRHLQDVSKDSAPSRKVDRIVLHQFSPSPTLSSPPLSEHSARIQRKPDGPAIYQELQRPETSRGRLVRTPATQLDNVKSSLQGQENSSEEELSLRVQKNREKKEEERERRVDGEVEEERKSLMMEREKRLLLLREEMRREEEDEEKKLKEESEERLR